MLSSENSVGMRSICETIPSTSHGSTSPGARITAGMWYFSSGISVRPALDAQWSAVMRKIVLPNHGCFDASAKNRPSA